MHLALLAPSPTNPSPEDQEDQALAQQINFKVQLPTSHNTTPATVWCCFIYILVESVFFKTFYQMSELDETRVSMSQPICAVKQSHTAKIGLCTQGILSQPADKSWSTLCVTATVNCVFVSAGRVQAGQ